MTHTLPYQCMPKIMLIPMVECVLIWLNNFPSKGGLSRKMSPAMLVEGKQKPDMKHKHITFGSYAMVYVTTKNTMTRRCILSIALNPSNQHGGHYFMSLFMGKRLNSYNWEENPIDNNVTERVEKLGK